MVPTRRIAGLAGIAAGVGLAAEFILFMVSGWTPDTFVEAERALRFLETGVGGLRAAAFVGVLNLGLAVVFLAGLAGVLARAAPTRAAAALYLGLIGFGAHALVPLGLWLGTPSFLSLASTDPGAAVGGWGGFAAFMDAAGGVGYLFTGAALIAAGWAIVGTRALSRGAGWVGVVGGAASALTVLTVGTPLAPLGQGAYMPALLLTIAFRIWAGVGLRAAPGSGSPAVSAAGAGAGPS